MLLLWRSREKQIREKHIKKTSYCDREKRAISANSTIRENTRRISDKNEGRRETQPVHSKDTYPAKQKCRNRRSNHPG
jgi:hypothetical protein